MTTLETERHNTKPSATAPVLLGSSRVGPDALSSHFPSELASNVVADGLTLGAVYAGRYTMPPPA